MFAVRKTEAYTQWIDGLRDILTHGHVSW